MLRAHAKILVEAPSERVFDFLTRFERFPAYDEKARTLNVLGQDADGLTHCEIIGHFGGVPFHARFKATIREGKGYSTEMISGPIRWARGQFWVRPLGANTEVTHTEEYTFGWGLLGWLAERLYRPYVQATVDREVESVKRLVEAST